MRSNGLTHGVVSGSLGTGNLGDTELLRAFLKRHGDDYDSLSVVADGPAVTSDDKIHVVSLPRFPLGRRWWRGYWDRNATRRAILESHARTVEKMAKPSARTENAAAGGDRSGRS